MWRLASVAVVAMVTTVASMAAVTTGDTNKVQGVGAEVLGHMAEVAVSLCSALPDLPACKDLNTTLMQEKQRHGGDKMEADHLDPHTDPILDPHTDPILDPHTDPHTDPILALVLTQCVSLHSHYEELMESVARLEAEKVSLVLEKMQLQQRLVQQGAVSGYTRHNRDTTDRLKFPLEASSSGLVVSALSPTPHLYAATFRPMDCTDYLLLGHTSSGVYKIYPFNCRCTKPVDVWCDMETEGGGWTVFLARQNRTTREDFNRNWSDYRAGFGNASGEYWLGNEVLHIMTGYRAYALRVDFRLTDGNLKWGEWPQFTVEDETNLYKLNVPKYNAQSTIDNCLDVHTGRTFSTFDYDNDGNTGKNCAEESKGGWWYNNCANLDPTIPFTAPGQLNTTCTYKMQAKKVPLHGPSLQMKIRPTVCDQSVKSVNVNGYTCKNHNL